MFCGNTSCANLIEIITTESIYSMLCENNAMSPNKRIIIYVGRVDGKSLPRSIIGNDMVQKKKSWFIRKMCTVKKCLSVKRKLFCRLLFSVGSCYTVWPQVCCYKSTITEHNIVPNLRHLTWKFYKYWCILMYIYI